MKMFFDQKMSPYSGLRILEAISPLALCLSGGDQMMPQCIIRNSLGDASRHHQEIKGCIVCIVKIPVQWSLPSATPPMRGHLYFKDTLS